MDIRHFDLLRYLSVLPLFGDLDREALQRVALGCHLRRLARGEMVFHAGQPCAELHVNVVGQIKLFALSTTGQEKVVELIGPGSSFAEARMFTERPYIVSAQALTETLLLSIDKPVVVEEIARDSRFALRMLAGISQQLHGLISDVEAYALHSGVRRVIGHLLRDVAARADADAARGEAITVSLPVSKATIASRLSLTPEYFSRVLRELETAGLIEVDKRDIRIRDPQRLMRYQPVQ